MTTPYNDDYAYRPEYTEHKDERAGKLDGVSVKKYVTLIVATGCLGITAFLLLALAPMDHLYSIDYNRPKTIKALMPENPQSSRAQSATREVNETLYTGAGELAVTGYANESVTLHLTKISTGESRNVTIDQGKTKRLNVPYGCHRIGWSSVTHGSSIIMVCLGKGHPNYSKLDLGNGV